MSKWSLERKHRYYLDAIKIYHADIIETLRKKLIEDVLKIQDDLAKEHILYHLDSDPFQNRLIDRINKRFGVKK